MLILIELQPPAHSPANLLTWSDSVLGIDLPEHRQLAGFEHYDETGLLRHARNYVRTCTFLSIQCLDESPHPSHATYSTLLPRLAGGSKAGF